MKTILKIIIIVLLVIAVALGIFFLLDRENNTSVVGERGEESGGLFGFIRFGDNQEPVDTTDITRDSLNNSTELETTTLNLTATLTQLSKTPVAGATFIGTSTVRFVDRGNGHIYETNLLDGVTKKILNQTTPRVYEAHWLNNGSSVIYQTLSNAGNVVSKQLNLEETASENSTETTYSVSEMPLEENITIIPSNSLLYSKNEGGKTVITDEQNNVLHTLPGTSWIFNQTTNGDIFATNKAHSSLVGSMFKLGPSKEKLLGAYNGLTTHTRNRYTLFSKTSNDAFLLSVKEMQTGFETELFPKTLPEKCSFLNTLDFAVICGVPKQIEIENYPESWYQGITSFEDVVVLYNLEEFEAITIHQPDQDMDIINPQLSSDDLYLMFVNKKDLTLWLLDLTKSIQTTN